MFFAKKVMLGGATLRSKMIINLVFNVYVAINVYVACKF
jgi:hypothetical protein